MVVLDASLLIAQLDGRDAFHDRAAGLLHAAASMPFAASVLTLAEVCAGPARRGALTQALGALQKMRIASVGLGPDSAGRLATLRAETGLKLPDCCVLLAAQDCGGRVVLTFDDRLRAAARTAGLLVDVP